MAKQAQSLVLFQADEGANKEVCVGGYVGVGKRFAEFKNNKEQL